MSRIICPFCLKPNDFSQTTICSHCGEKVPSQFIRNYQEIPPLWLSFVGPSRHGKTTFLSAMTLTLDGMDQIYEDIYSLPVDQFSQDAIKAIRKEADERKTPEATNKTEPIRPILYDIKNFPMGGSRCLVMFDVAGETFESFDLLEKYAPALREVTTTWFLISLSDLQKGKSGETITDIFNAYQKGMERMNVNINGRNLIVVYSKGDTLIDDPEIRDYLLDDPFAKLSGSQTTYNHEINVPIDEYMTEVREMSDYLREYTKHHVFRGRAFINMVEDMGMKLVFSVTSALGEGTNNGRQMASKARRYRVLDPLLWAIELAKPTKMRKLCLIVDSSNNKHTPFSDEFVLNLWDQLSRQNELISYQLGVRNPLSLPGQAPSMLDTNTQRPSLIGPILEDLEPDTTVVLLTSSPVLDLDDFTQPEWYHRIFFASINYSVNSKWPARFNMQSNTSTAAIVESFNHLITH